MPTYVYRREDGSTFEIEQRITDDPLEVDPQTGQPVKRVITGAGLIFKGEGFYLTDYARKGNGSAEATPKKEGSTDSSQASDATAKPSTTEPPAPTSKKSG